ncbi:MAG: hypothetical protein V4692_06615 [Bdellovibrionota bacterium]
MSKNIFVSLIMFAVTSVGASSAFAQVPCESPNAPGSKTQQVRIAQVIKNEATMTVITPNNNGRNLKISDTLCFTKAKLDKLEVASQNKEPITLVVKDNQIIDIQ